MASSFFPEFTDERPTAKKPNGIGKHLKKLFRFGPRSTPQPSAPTLQGDFSSSLESSGVQLKPDLSTRQQYCRLTDEMLSSKYSPSHTNPVVRIVVIAIWTPKST